MTAGGGFWASGAPGPSLQLDRSTGPSIAVDKGRLAHLPIREQRAALPVASYRLAILHAVETKRCLVVVGETGSGKTTQIPQYLYEAGWTAGGRCVVCTQPRRLAAVSVAERVAQEMGVKVGEEVGYAVRFGEKRSRDPTSTRLLFCTEGMLLREMMLDPLLSRHSVVMLDEAHERTVYTDLLFGLIRKVMRRRPGLRLIVSSACLDAEAFRDFFNFGPETSTILTVQGRQHSVDVLYSTQPVPNYMTAAVETVIKIHKMESPGDMLVFMPGQEEVDSVVRTLKDEAPRTISAIPLYASLPQSLQSAVFKPPPAGSRKVIVATSIAETSITLCGVCFVIDPCLARMPFFDAGVQALVTIPASKASTVQRAGRAGRIAPGKCFRLLTESDYQNSIPQCSIPEMCRSDLSWAVLQLKALGISNVAHFDFLSPPPPSALARALELLFSLGALDEEGELTSHGAHMAEMPVEPRLAKVLIAAKHFECTEDVLSVAAMLSVQGPWLQHRMTLQNKEALRESMREFAAPEGDHITYVRLYEEWQSQSESSRASWCGENMLDHRAMSRASEVRQQLKRYVTRLEKRNSNSASAASDGNRIVKDEPTTSSFQRYGGNELQGEPLRKAFVAGFFSHAARLCSDGQYRTVCGNVAVAIHPTSVMTDFGPVPPFEYIIYHELARTTQLFARDVSGIKPQWLAEQAPHFYAVQRGNSYRS
eukprot:381677_1